CCSSAPAGNLPAARKPPTARMAARPSASPQKIRVRMLIPPRCEQPVTVHGVQLRRVSCPIFAAIPHDVAYITSPLQRKPRDGWTPTAFRPALLAELRKRRAHRFAENLDKPAVRPVQLQD